MEIWDFQLSEGLFRGGAGCQLSRNHEFICPPPTSGCSLFTYDVSSRRLRWVHSYTPLQGKKVRIGLSQKPCPSRRKNVYIYTQIICTCIYYNRFWQKDVDLDFVGFVQAWKQKPYESTTWGDNSRIPHLLDIKAVKGCPQDHQCHNWLRGCFERNNGPSIASLIMIPT